MGNGKQHSVAGRGASRSGLPGNDPDSGCLSGDLAVVVTQDGTVHAVLQGADLPEDSRADLVGQSLDALWPRDIADRLRANVRSAIRGRHFFSESLDCDGRDLEFTFIVHARDRALVLVRDVTEQAHALAQIHELAYIDDTTRLPNLKFLRKELDEIIDHHRLTEARIAVICLDVDQVAAHGIVYDPRRQERILEVIGDRLRQELRGVNDRQALSYERYSAAARIDFRQFAVVLPCIGSGNDAEAVTMRLIESLREPIDVEGGSTHINAHAGIALFPQDGNDGNTLTENALAAMEDARASHAEPYKFYSGTARLPALQRKDVELELKTALEREEFSLNYLPIVAAGTREVVAVEALLRWPQSLVANRSIVRILSLAEHTGLIVPIGEWVLDTACSELGSLRERGFPRLHLAVNLSVQEFSRSDLAATVESTLRRTGIDAAALDFEITEYMLFRDAMKNFRAGRALKALGVRLTVDDFGTGACSLENLAHSPVDALKIDNSFVARLADTDRDRAACAAAAALAAGLGLDIVAEGVETEEQAKLLAAFGCHRLQGFLFSQPLAADDLVPWLGRHATESA